MHRNTPKNSGYFHKDSTALRIHRRRIEAEKQEEQRKEEFKLFVKRLQLIRQKRRTT